MTHVPTKGNDQPFPQPSSRFDVFEPSNASKISDPAAISKIMGAYGSANTSLGTTESHGFLAQSSSSILAPNGNTALSSNFFPSPAGTQPQFARVHGGYALPGQHAQSILKTSNAFDPFGTLTNKPLMGILRQSGSPLPAMQGGNVTLNSLISTGGYQISTADSLAAFKSQPESTVPKSTNFLDPFLTASTPSSAVFDPFDAASLRQAGSMAHQQSQPSASGNGAKSSPLTLPATTISTSPVASPASSLAPPDLTAGRKSRRVVTMNDLRAHAEATEDPEDDDESAAGDASAAGAAAAALRPNHHVTFATGSLEGRRRPWAQLRAGSRRQLRTMDEDEINELSRTSSTGSDDAGAGADAASSATGGGGGTGAGVEPGVAAAATCAAAAAAGGSRRGSAASGTGDSGGGAAAGAAGLSAGAPAPAGAEKSGRGRKERRVRTVNDLRSFQKELAQEQAEAQEEPRLDALISASRPLTPRTRDPAKETRMELFQSHDLFGQYGMKEKEMLEKKRSARQARKRNCSREDLPSLGSDGASESGGSVAELSSFGSSSSDKRRTSMFAPGLKLMQKNAVKQLRQIDPALKAKLPKGEEVKIFWIKIFLSVVIGVCTGICVQFISLLSTQLLMNAKQSTVQAMLREGHLLEGFAAHAGMSVLLAVATSIIVVGLPGPLAKVYGGCAGAGGSGLPEVKTYLSGVLDKHRMVETRTLIAKIFALSFLVASGIPASRDMIHVAALIATNVISRWIPWEQILIQRKVISQPLMQASDAPKFVMVSAAVAAGVGASFRCPFAGIMFAFEEFSSHWTQETGSMCMLASGVASLVAWYFTGTDSASQWYLSNFEDTTGRFDPSLIRIVPAAFANVKYPTLKIMELVILIFLGVLGGLWGSIFVILNGKGLAFWRKKNMGGKYAKYKRFVEITLVAIFTSAVAVLLPYLWPCRPLTPDEEDALLEKGQRISWKTSTCEPGFVNEMASLCFQGQGTAMNNLFAESNDMQFSEGVLFVYGAVYFIVTVLSVGTASPAGAVIPMVLSGAAWGRGFGVVMHDTFNWVGNQHPHVRFYAVMGGAAGLAGFFRMPMAITAMMVEISGNCAFTAPLFISCTVAKVTADRIAQGFINFMCRFNDYPLLKEAPPPAFYLRNALDIMTELDGGIAYAPYVIGAGDGVTQASALLDNTKHNSFPVVVDPAQDVTLRGLVERRHLVGVVEAHRRGGKGGGDDDPGAAAAAAAAAAAEFQKDLAAVMQINPPVVNEGMPADRVYNWFVSLGIRRLIVVKDGTMEVTGIITRHDLHEAFIKWR